MKKPITKNPKIEIKQLKPKRIKARGNVRISSNTCPNCLSVLKINKSGKLECSGNQLELWKKEFNKYSKLNESQKKKYLNKLVNKEKFLEWYSQKDNLKCGWTNKASKIEPTYNTTIPDPMTVGKIEKSLGRNLTEEELYENKYLYKKKLENGKYEYKSVVDNPDWLEFMEDCWEKVDIPKIKFPDEV